MSHFVLINGKLVSIIYFLRLNKLVKNLLVCIVFENIASKTYILQLGFAYNFFYDTFLILLRLGRSGSFNNTIAYASC